jgi:hypothetical protein
MPDSPDATKGQVVLADMEQRVVDRDAAGHHAVEQHLHRAPSWLKG